MPARKGTRPPNAGKGRNCREDVPVGLSSAEFWRAVMDGAESLADCIERRMAIPRFDRNLTATQRWMRQKRKQERGRSEIIQLQDRRRVWP